MWYLVDRISGILAPERWYKTGRNTHLDVYDVGGEKHEEFDDTFNVPGSDTIQEYFRNLKPDTPKYLRLFEAELIVEFLAVTVISIVNLRKKRKKYR